MTAQVIPFNPLDKQNLGASVAEAMLDRPVTPLGAVPRFNGAGIYAIYYVGSFPAYQRLSDNNRDGRFLAPIYVGKAVPEGGRKGTSIASVEDTRKLSERLREHAKSIGQVSNLSIDDFYCRFLVVDDVWIPLGESLLITKFMPVWNSLVDGFGNHDTGRRRYEGLRPRWDVLHPGRAWAAKCQARSETAGDIEREVVNYLSNATFPQDQKLIEPNPGQPDVPGA